jgi:protein TonB
MATYSVSTLQLPWSLTQDDRRFKNILAVFLLIFIGVSIPIMLIKLPELTREEKEALPPQLARVILEKQELPPPKPIEPPKVEEVKPEVKPEEIKPEPKKPEEKVVAKPPEQTNVKPVEQRPATNRETASTAAVAAAREQASNSGVMQFKDDLADMREALDVSDVKTTSTNTVTRSTGTAAQVERSMITSGAQAKSGGVNVAALSRDTGGVALSGRETTAVASKMAAVSAVAAESREQQQQQTREKAFRGDQSIRQKMEEAKGRIFGIYNRALRENPALQGKVTFKLVIEPNGSVSSAQIISSELNNPELERKLLAAIRGIEFGASDVMQTTLNYSFDFLPY